MTPRRKHHQDISIEDILKSIKGIINPHKQDKDNAEEQDILELTEILEDNNQNEIFEDAERENFISTKTADQVVSRVKAFEQKAKDTSGPCKKSLGDISAEELLMELLRSELKLWLDKNLPEIIDRTLAKELKELMTKRI